MVSSQSMINNQQATDLMLRISNLNVYYGESHILRDVDMSVPEGQMVCLIGRNGVGKTTLLKTILGLLHSRTGDILFRDRSIAKLPTDRRVKQGIGYVPQGREIIPRVSVKDNLLLGLEAKPQGRKGNESIPESIFELFPVLKTMLSRMGGDLRLLVLDEPTEGIQPSIILEIEAAVKKIIAETGISVLLVEQHLHFVRQADRYYAMQKGGIVASGNTADLSQEVIQQFLAV